MERVHDGADGGAAGGTSLARAPGVQRCRQRRASGATETTGPPGDPREWRRQRDLGGGRPPGARGRQAPRLLDVRGCPGDTARRTKPPRCANRLSTIGCSSSPMRSSAPRTPGNMTPRGRGDVNGRGVIGPWGRSAPLDPGAEGDGAQQSSRSRTRITAYPTRGRARENLPARPVGPSRTAPERAWIPEEPLSDASPRRYDDYIAGTAPCLHVRFQAPELAFHAVHDFREAVEHTRRQALHGGEHPDAFSDCLDARNHLCSERFVRCQVLMKGVLKSFSATKQDIHATMKTRSPVL